MKRFQSQVAFISGGGSGIGAALAAALAREGAACAVSDIDGKSAESVAAGLRETGAAAIGLQLDVTDAVAWRECVARSEAELGPIELLCSNAGVTGATKPLVELPADYMRWVLDVNVMGALNAIQAVVPGMRARGRGLILFTASIGGLGARPMVADYCASKSALIALAESLSQEVSADGLRVSVLCPATVTTNLATTTRKATPTTLSLDVAPDSPQVASFKAQFAAATGRISADDAARRALDGLAQGLFFIFTHANFSEGAQSRAKEIERSLEALRRQAPPNTDPLSNLEQTGGGRFPSTGLKHAD